MPSEEYQAFKERAEFLFSLESPGSLHLRKVLGGTIDSAFRNYLRGTVQRLKQRFIAKACELASLDTKAREPHRIISTLKNSGNGDASVAAALGFLAMKTVELDRIRVEVFRQLDDGGMPDPESGGSWPPDVAYHLAEIVKLPNLREKFVPRKPDKPGEREIKAAKFSGLLGRGESSFASAESPKIEGREFLTNSISDYTTAYQGGSASFLALVDVDGMTKLNKKYGVLTGDAVLQTIQFTIERLLQGIEHKMGRCGDDSFYVLLCGAAFDQGLRLMDGIRQAIANHLWEGQANGLWVTVSIGVASSSLGEPSLDYSIRAALGMKNAKARGGNSVAIGPTELPEYFVRGPLNLYMS